MFPRNIQFASVAERYHVSSKITYFIDENFFIRVAFKSISLSNFNGYSILRFAYLIKQVLDWSYLRNAQLQIEVTLKHS